MNKIDTYSNRNIPNDIEKLYSVTGNYPIKDANPIPSYLKICINGASKISNEFLSDFVITTYLNKA